MSGIAGLYHCDGRPADPADLQRMLARLAHRGPDGAGSWHQGPVGLGQVMLQATPEARHERMPMRHRDQDLVLTADARVDNRQELIALLGLAGRPLAELTDGELILAAYERWGEACPARLVGDFAFAVWDGRRQVLFCARDAMGVKPFFFHRSSHGFAFASEIKALLCLPEVPRRLDETRVADFLVPMLEDDQAATFYQGICRLLAGHSLAVGACQAPPRRYWALDPQRELRLGSDDEYVEAFLACLAEAVRCRLRSPGRVGSLLSGGLDSSSIACLAREQLAAAGRAPLHTFSAVFDDLPQCDEREFIGAVLAGGSLESHYVAADRLSPLAYLARQFDYQDEAFWLPNLFWIDALYEAAAGQGVRVLLDGTDGDTAVSHGEAYLTELARAGRWLALVAEARALARNAGHDPWGLVRAYGFRALLPEPVRRAWRWLRRRNRPWWSGPEVVRADFLGRPELAGRVRQAERSRSRTARSAREDHIWDMESGANPYCLEILDRAAAARGLEPRYPYFDRRLVELCVALPPEQKLRQGWSRSILRRSLAGVLPEAIRWRGGKADLSPNFARALARFDGELLDAAVRDSEGIGAYLDMAALGDVHARFLARPATAPDRRMAEDAVALWKATMLSLWLRHAGLGRRETTPREAQLPPGTATIEVA